MASQSNAKKARRASKKRLVAGRKEKNKGKRRPRKVSRSSVRKLFNESGVHIGHVRTCVVCEQPFQVVDLKAARPRSCHRCGADRWERTEPCSISQDG